MVNAVLPPAMGATGCKSAQNWQPGPVHGVHPTYTSERNQGVLRPTKQFPAGLLVPQGLVGHVVGNVWANIIADGLS